jgi:AraC family transcriptional regulator
VAFLSWQIRGRDAKVSAMPETNVLKSGPLTVVEYRCRHGAHERPYAEQHLCASVSYVRCGTFGYRARGRAHDLVAGSVLVGHTGDEFICTHDHRGGGDECLSFQLTPELVSELGDRLASWRVGVVPPLPELMVWAELAQASADGQTDVGLDEAGLGFVSRFLRLCTGAQPGAYDARPLLRRRVVESALWIDENSAHDVDLQSAARQAGMSPFHYLRLFSRVLGVTPHQYLVRCRLRHAARLLGAGASSVTSVALEVGFGDVSNFVRTFRRAAHTTPRRFRALAQRSSPSANARASRNAQRGRS